MTDRAKSLLSMLEALREDYAEFGERTCEIGQPPSSDPGEILVQRDAERRG